MEVGWYWIVLDAVGRCWMVLDVGSLMVTTAYQIDGQDGHALVALFALVATKNGEG